ncbi:hypothetical protein [Actinoplanes sp. HUAS TT8]|uniref:hypothetical protein n=1 Tax=Actinoplanes sp. HUAS TT8 TaxID=3447453 RepID=UPI003F527B37
MVTLHGRVAEGVPRWVIWCAYAAPFTVLPSGIWRLALVVAGAHLIDQAPSAEGRGPVVWDGPLYVVVLTVVSELLAYLTVGLVAVWGEVVPRWVPRLGGRPIPVLAAVVPAAAGATICTILWPYALFMLAEGQKLNGTPGVMHFDGAQMVLFWAAYSPLLLWGPLVWVCTVHYWRRRSAAAELGAAVR